jgi:hypothetical protein
MGHQFRGICKKCRRKYTIKVGDGFFIHLLHCDRCGKDKVVRFKELGEIRLKYIKGQMLAENLDKLDFLHDCVVFGERALDYSGNPISEKEYYGEVETKAGTCKCGGKYKMNAPPRCPKCKCVEYEIDPKGPEIMYD